MIPRRLSKKMVVICTQAPCPKCPMPSYVGAGDGQVPRCRTQRLGQFCSQANALSHRFAHPLLQDPQQNRLIQSQTIRLAPSPGSFPSCCHCHKSTGTLAESHTPSESPHTTVQASGKNQTTGPHPNPWFGGWVPYVPCHKPELT